MVKKVSRTKTVNPTAVFKLLADANRYRTLQLLSQTRKGLLVGDIADMLRIEQSAASHVLGLLYNHGAVRYLKDGRTVRYFLSTTPVAKTLQLIMRAVA